MSIKQKKGISLIVLVITIIVMIILATAIILTLNGSGIIGKAKEAKTVSDLANAKNVVAVAKAEWDLMDKTKKEDIGKFSTYAESELSKAGFKVGGHGGITVSDSGAINTIYIDTDDTQVIIPEGFTVSSVSTEQTVDTGLVIVDKEGNEFVWVPVPEMDEFVRVDWVNGNYEYQAKFSDCTEPFSKTTSAGITLSLTNDLTGEYLEYEEMYESVNKNGGFYIGRYETGTTTSRTNTSNGTTDVLVQMNKPVYNYVTWGPSMVSTVGDVTYSGKNQGKGAVELSRNMYKTSTSVVSTLCYGVQWDATLRFIATNPEHVTFPTDSTGKGHHTYPLSETGCYAVNNIYDMAGNASEWTMESYGTSNRVLRGGGYWLDPADSPAGMRTMSRQPKYVDNVYGFRIALYIK